jgi:hydrogenase expression/formation protein HypC
MCLGVPGRVVEVFEQHGVRMGTVDFGGVRRTACLEYAPEVQLDDYVIIHVGFAISVVDQEEAARSYQLLAEMGNLEGVDLPQDPDGVRDLAVVPGVGEPQAGSPAPEGGVR